MLVTAWAALSFSNPASAAVVINDPTFTSSNTTLDCFYKIITPSSSVHRITSLTATSFSGFGSLVPTDYIYSVTFYADNAGSRGTALTSAISSSSVTGLLSAAPTMASPPWYRFEVTFDRRLGGVRTPAQTREGFLSAHARFLKKHPHVKVRVFCCVERRSANRKAQPSARKRRYYRSRRLLAQQSVAANQCLEECGLGAKCENRGQRPQPQWRLCRVAGGG